MIRKVSLCFMTLMLMGLATGCWDSHDISERSILIVTALDLNQEGGRQFGEPVQYDATILMPNLNQESPEKVRLEKVSGVSQSGSRDQRAYINPELILVRMVRVALFGESVAKLGLTPALDTFYRNPFISNAISIAITTGRSSDVITVQPEDSPDLGIYLKNMLSTVSKKSFFPVVTLHNFKTQASTKGRNPVLPILTVDNGEVKISGLGIFRKDQLIGQVGLDESRSLALLRGDKGHGYIPFVLTQEDSLIDRGTISAKNERQVRVKRQGDQVTFDITIALTGDLIEHESRVILTKEPGFLSMIETHIASDIENECRAFIERMQEEFKVDCIDISKYALAQWRNELEDTIEEGFIEQVNINVEVKVRIKETGDIM